MTRRELCARLGTVACGLVCLLLAGALGGGEPASGAPRSRQMQPQASSGYGHIATWDVGGVLLEPLDVTLSPGRMFVADGRRNAVYAYDQAGNMLARWDLAKAVAGCDPLVPFSLAVDPAAGRVYSGWHCYQQGTKNESGFYLDSRRADGTDPRPVVFVNTSTATDLDLHLGSGQLVVVGNRSIDRLDPTTGARVSSFELPAGVWIRARIAVIDDTVLLARPAFQGLSRFTLDGLELPKISLDGRRPAAVAVAPDGRFAVLIDAPRTAPFGPPDPPAGPVIVVVSADGQTMTSMSEADLGPGLPQDSLWRWSIAMDASHVVYTSAGDRFEVHRVAFDDLDQHRIQEGGPARSDFTPAVFAPMSGDEPFALAAADSGGATVLDAEDGLLLSFDRAGRAAILGPAPDGATDIAIGDDDSLYVAAGGARLMRLAQGDRPGWEVECQCDLGGRIAAGAGSVWVARPRARSLVQLNADNGQEIAQRGVPVAAGLWPTDVSARGNHVVTAEIANGRVHRWPPSGEPEAFEAGLGAGPRRLSVGSQGDVAVLAADNWVEVFTAEGYLAERFRPTLADGTVIEGWDVAMGQDRTILLADGFNRSIHVFAPGAASPGATSTPTPTSAPPPGDRSCAVSLVKDAQPRTVVQGRPVTITMGFASACPGGATAGYDVVLAIDTSDSMSGVGLRAAQAAARAFTERLDVRYHHLGVVAFANDATVVTPVTDDVPSVLDGIDGLAAGGGTNLSAALERADQALVEGGRPGAVPVIVLLSDGSHAGGTRTPRAVAADVKARGVIVYAIGLTPSNVQLLHDLASGEERYFHAPDVDDLMSIYTRILQELAVVVPGSLMVSEQPAFRPVRDSMVPPAVVGASELNWRHGTLPEGMLSFAYSAVPDEPGVQAVSRGSEASFVDTDGARRREIFPEVIVNVITVTPPLATAPTPTVQTPTPTPRTHTVHLPVLANQSCARPAATDIVVVLDVSRSMAEPLPGGSSKLAAAAAAITDWAGRRPERDRIALVTFGGQARVEVSLTDPPGRLEAALSTLELADGSRLDLGLAAAADLPRAPGRPNAARAVIVLTDGRVSAPDDAVIQAERLRAQGARVYAIGLGQGVDVVTLLRVASNGLFFWVEDAPALELANDDLATLEVCAAD